jgi:uncharacterized membrane protein HdeD (DUF308 family)
MEEIMAEGIVGGIRRASGWSIALGILMILIGMIAVAVAPFEAGVILVMLIGWTAIFNGGAQLFYAFSGHEQRHRWLEVLLGVLYIIAGIYLLLHPIGGLLALTLLMAIFLLVYGIFALILAFRMRPAPGWGWVLFDAIITVVLGVLIYIHWPLNTEWVVGTLFGISFIVSGVSRLMMSLAVRRLTAKAA